MFLSQIRKVALLLTLPSLIFSNDCQLPLEECNQTPEAPLWNTSRPFSYDDVLELIDDIENGDLGQHSPEELGRMNQFIAILAKAGILPHESDYEVAALNQDIHSLLGQSSDIGYTPNGQWHAIPGVFYGDSPAILCRSWVKKAWDSTREFVKKHKKQIIIGAAVVVAVAATITVVVLTCGTGSAAVAASREQR
jgi:hypothetical protein